ncbi:precorrin-6A/cobalt-precorrin-6A reductase [Ovoidimarina sediminis]|uniref:precorrin-6A/cobalt-precorrin-6A reductase n=1 Tax=Ovoidimarina sediminis TaxID=3079856 RepID=UPI00290B3FD3|nr:precorrin-6A/cobalt-precorrin-6A reductase [Rhodophyticola sp. MJ-SS7]MDU8941964.1 precorrin-6A/cobalt-precorrin-6A reductase [Rhodophyticola sp. MJ-SS7]
MRLLLLAGTPESVEIGHALSRDGRVSVTASMARASRAPLAMNVPMRIGGWGGVDRFHDWMTTENVGAVLDVTHPFAVSISSRTAAVCADLGVPYVQFLRPAWTPGRDDNWVFLNSEEEAAGHVPDAARVLLMTGRRRLEAFRALGKRPIFVRVRDRGSDPFPFEEGAFIHRPVQLPVTNEIAGLRSLGVNWIVARNSGGTGSMPVIEAAQRLGLPVGMVRRPPQPEVPRIRTISEALAWVRRRL